MRSLPPTTLALAPALTLALPLALTLATTSAAAPAPADLPTVTIGAQVWLARNLDATHFANGDDPAHHRRGRMGRRRAAGQARPIGL
jgi:hypothetical protein